MQKSLFPGYTIGPDAYEDIVNVCPAYGKKVAIIGGKQALAAANDLMRVYSMLDVKLNRSLLDNIMLLGLHHAVEPLEVGAEQENWEIP